MAINPKLLNDGESVVVDTRTHAKALIVPLLMLLVIVALAVLADTTFAGGVVAWIVWILAGVLALWFCVRPLLEWLTATYTITSRRLITRSGVLARKGHDIPISRISDVSYELGVIDRMLGCGTLIISDASTNGRVLLHDIPHVEDVQRKLNELLHHGDASSANDGT